MRAGTWPGPLASGDRALVSELAAVLADGGYDSAAVREALDIRGELQIRPEDRPLLRRRLAGLGRAGTMMELFALGDALLEDDAARAFAPLGIERLEALGVVERGGGLVRSPVRILPSDDLLVASDPPGEDQPPDHVAGVHNASVTLGQLTVRLPVETALDAATGCGYQALLAARHAGTVVATDVNERALGFAAFNAALNGVENVELRAGSFFEPVRGERFGLAVCNPPYVISPERAYVFRDSGLPGDTVSEHVVRALPGTLVEGGFASAVISWVHHASEHWAARLGSWVAESGCDALLLHYGTQDPLTHAGNWTRELYGGRPEAFEQALARWLRYLEEQGIDGVAYGAVVLRRRAAGPGRVRAYDVPPTGTTAAAAHLVRLFENEDYLEGLPDEAALLGARLRLAPDARVRQRAVLEEGAWAVEAMEIELEQGLRFAASVDPSTSLLLAELDGRRTLAEIALELAGRQGVDPGPFAHGAVPVARGMLELGFVEPAGP